MKERSLLGQLCPWNALSLLGLIWPRLRYPSSLPEDVSIALGIPLSNYLTHNALLKQLTSPHCRPSSLSKYMPREKAEQCFSRAVKTERSAYNSLFSFNFAGLGWIVIDLRFDNNSRLRRVYIQHKEIQHDQGVELYLL